MTDITITDLYDEGACFSQRREFTDRFPNGVDVTVDKAIEYADVFDWDWAAEHFLTEPLYMKFRETYVHGHDKAINATREVHKRNDGICSEECEVILHNMHVKDARTFAELYLSPENEK